MFLNVHVMVVIIIDILDNMLDIYIYIYIYIYDTLTISVLILDYTSMTNTYRFKNISINNINYIHSLYIIIVYYNIYIL